MTDLDAIRARHVPHSSCLTHRDMLDVRVEHCASLRCTSRWPCDTAQVLAALDAANADAERLAEALMRVVHPIPGLDLVDRLTRSVSDDPDQPNVGNLLRSWQAALDAALRAHEERGR